MTGARPVSPAVSAEEFARTYEACKNCPLCQADLRHPPPENY
jgi:hypothetical protein